MPLNRSIHMTKPTANNPDFVALLIDLLKVATRIARPMRDDVADPEDVSVTELRIILALGGEGDLAGHDLAELMAMQPMNVSRALGTLLDLGLVEQVDNSENKRRKPYRLSKSGQAKFASMTQRMAHVSEFVFEALNKDEMKRIGPILAKLDQHLCEWESPPDPQHVRRA
jgi:DNA-binding MarR family transcriptional regulator